jgi:hypothetical protein
MQLQHGMIRRTRAALLRRMAWLREPARCVFVCLRRSLECTRVRTGVQHVPAQVRRPDDGAANSAAAVNRLCSLQPFTRSNHTKRDTMLSGIPCYSRLTAAACTAAAITHQRSPTPPPNAHAQC